MNNDPVGVQYWQGVRIQNTEQGIMNNDPVGVQYWQGVGM